MKKSFAARRVARKVGGFDEPEDNTSDSASSAQANDGVVKRPTSKLKSKSSSSRLSFGPKESAEEGNEEGAFKPKKSNLSRLAQERNAERAAERTTGDEARPSYTKDALEELKKSSYTAPAPKDAHAMQVDIAAKFGPLAALRDRPLASAIPTELEIKEKKARRARLAKEQQYISLNSDDEEEDRAPREEDLPSDDEFLDRRARAQLQVSTRAEDKWGCDESRLIREDEDIAEGFDDFTQDGKILVGRKAEKEAAARRKVEMAELIDEAEGHSEGDDGTDDSEAERNAAYEEAQTRAGTYGSRGRDEWETRERPRTPPRIAPLPDLGAVLEKARARVREMDEARALREQRLAEIRREKVEIAEREVWIQQQLKETGERYEKLRVEAGLAGTQTPVNGLAVGDGKVVVRRGLESLGTLPPSNGTVEE